MESSCCSSWIILYFIAIKMANSICDLGCNQCDLKNQCNWCIATNWHPFWWNCVLANVCGNKECVESQTLINEYKSQLIDEINALWIKDMPKVTELFALKWDFINLEYELNGQKIKFWNDNDIYLWAQLPKDEKTCFWITANDEYILVCEYGENWENPKIVMFKRR